MFGAVWIEDNDGVMTSSCLVQPPTCINRGDVKYFTSEALQTLGGTDQLHFDFDFRLLVLEFFSGICRD